MRVSYLDDETGRLIDCDGEDTDIAISSPLFQRWLKRLSLSIEVRSLLFQSVDVIHRGTPKERAIFIKFHAEAIDARRRPLLPGIVLLRGNAVACLVVLRNRGNYYAVLVRQARLGVGDEILEIPAGMQDDDDDPCRVVLRELEEECGLVIPATQVFALTKVPLLTSPGLLDEAIHLYYTELDVTDEELAAMQGQTHGCADEHEHIELEIVEMSALPRVTADLKTITAFKLWVAELGLNPHILEHL